MRYMYEDVELWKCLKLYQVFEISPSLHVVELQKSYGDASVYRQVS